jgi:hypothetical protein
MAIEPYKPEFPYKGNQAIISSGRILFHAKEDSIFLFGKKAVGISSIGVINMDAYEGITLNTSKIELGLKAKDIGENIMLGLTTNQMLVQLLDELERVGSALTQLSKTGLPGASIAISAAGEALTSKSNTIKNNLKDYSNLSKITYTI